MKFTNQNKSELGFSLIELLVVVAIIGVLAAAGLIAYTKYLDSTKADTVQNNLKVLTKIMQADHASLTGGTSGISDLVRGADSQSTCHLIATRMVQTINSDNSVVNPYHPGVPNRVAAYGNALIAEPIATRKIYDGAIIVNCLNPSATPSDPSYKIYTCVFTRDEANKDVNVFGPSLPENQTTIPDNTCPEPVIPAPMSNAYAPS